MCSGHSISASGRAQSHLDRDRTEAVVAGYAPTGVGAGPRSLHRTAVVPVRVKQRIYLRRCPRLMSIGSKWITDLTVFVERSLRQADR
jgi:hypothetical protein